MQEQNTINRPKDGLVIIRQGETFYGIYSSRVLEIVNEPRITAMPKQPDYLRGLFNYKGRIVPVLSFGKLCGEERKEQERVCILFSLHHQTMGMLVEDVTKMIYDEGREIPCSEEERIRDHICIRKVLMETVPVFVLDLPEVIKRLGTAART
ncbi:MAG: chemotaxis protein CheW [Lachnospiraceae bacterium]|nr:chemotaxis protein CheW [Lachnospiraceae bacterium]